eukprot:Tbor_TRINITY_DN5144_c0_g1::TRINITY_DN5144_c0_g1_i1::g.25901::m.25901
MGSSNSKAIELPPGVKAYNAEEINRIRHESYSFGVSDTLQRAKQWDDETIMMGALGGMLACVMSSFATAMYYNRKGENSRHHLSKIEAASKEIFSAKEAELMAERARVLELSAVTESQKNMLDYQHQTLSKTNQQYNTLMARFRQLKQEHYKLKTRYQPLKFEVRTLREANGVLNQKFMASTAGAIVMAMVAAGLAIASHGGHGGDHADTDIKEKYENTPAACKEKYEDTPAACKSDDIVVPVIAVPVPAPSVPFSDISDDTVDTVV